MINYLTKKKPYNATKLRSDTYKITIKFNMDTVVM